MENVTIVKIENLNEQIVEDLKYSGNVRVVAINKERSYGVFSVPTDCLVDVAYAVCPDNFSYENDSDDFDPSEFEDGTEVWNYHGELICLDSDDDNGFDELVERVLLECAVEIVKF